MNGAVIAAHTMHGINDWTEKSYIVTEAGDFTFVFGYTKDSSVDRNEDTVWLDNIRFEEPVSVTGIELPANETVYIGTPLTLVPVISRKRNDSNCCMGNGQRRGCNRQCGRRCYRCCAG